MHPILCHIQSDRVISPAVGTYDITASEHSLTHRVIGTLIRLKRRYPLVIPLDSPPFAPDLPSGTPVMAGTPIGHFIHHQNPIITPDLTQNHIITSPNDGFLCFTDSAGNPYLQPGDNLIPGSRIATVEFMKLHIDIAYDMKQKAKFIQYIGSSPRSVKRGDPIAECRWI